MILRPDLAICGLAHVDIGRVGESSALQTFLADGSYNRTDWETRDLISKERLNKLEDGLWWNTYYDKLTVKTYDELTQIQTAYISEGTLCYVSDEDKYYYFTLVSGWRELRTGGGGFDSVEAISDDNETTLIFYSESSEVERVSFINGQTKFDDVKAGMILDGDGNETVKLEFFSNGSKVKEVEFSGGSGGGGKQGTLTTDIGDYTTIKEKETVIIPYTFESSNYGEATLYITIVNGASEKETTHKIKKQGVGSVNIGTLNKGVNRISMYAVDALSKPTNLVTFTIVCGALEIKSTFDDSLDYQVYSSINIPVTVSALDATEEMTLNVDINGTKYSNQVSNGYNSFPFPDEKKYPGVYRLTMQVTTNTFQSNILEFNIVISDATSILVSSEYKEFTVEAGYMVNIPYRVSNTAQNMFYVTYYVNGESYKEEQINIGPNTFVGDYRDFPMGEYTLTIEVRTIDESMSGSLNIRVLVVPNSFARITHETNGLEAYFNMNSKNNNSLDKEFLLSEVVSSKGTTAKLVLHDYNFATNGWIDGRLVSNGGAWAEVVDYLPLVDNAESGFTFDILFSNNNMGENDARVIDCTGITAPYKGFYIDSEKAALTTESNNISTYYTDRTDMKVTFVVNRTSTYYEEYITDENGYSVLNPNPTYKPNPMVQIFIDGVFTEVAMLSDQTGGGNKILESIQNDSSLLINTDKDKQLFGNCSIKSIRIYNIPLSHEKVLQNYMADFDDLMEQKAIYDKNYVTVDQNIPRIDFYDTDIGKCDLMTKDTKQWVNVVYTSPDAKRFGESFDLMGQASWQGTSSLAYPVKNYKFKLYDWARNEEGDIIEESRNDKDTYTKVKINMYPADDNGYPESTFCLKADYMDSSHCRNTGTARAVNDFLFDGYDNPAKQIDPKTRDTINGFPCQLYINGKPMGVFNFNHDKSCTKTLGMETIPDTVRWEIKANSDTSAGAFFKTWTNIDECYEAILGDFEIVFDEDAFEENSGEYDLTKYYDELGFSHSGAVTGGYKDYAILSLARFVNFVATADEETWKANSDNYFNKVQACRYYLNTMTLGLIDNFAKNCIINMYGDDIWWFSFYDLDSSLGLDNTGYNKFSSNIEPSQEGIYNCSTSNMWVKLNEWSQDDLFNQFNIIRESKYTYENICKYLIEKQIDIIPQRLYNEDMYSKYISQGRQYLHMLHGNNKDHLLRWLYNRFQYVDSLFLQHNSPYTKQNITIRSCKPANAVPKYDSEGNIISQYTARFEIETYCPQYVTVCWRKNTFETKRVDWGETVIFENDMVNSQDNELIVYCASNLKRLGNCSNLNPTSADIGNANRLTEFICEGSDKLVKADISKNAYLKRVSFNGCSVLGTASGGSNILDVSTCTGLKEIDLRGTQITALTTNINGGNLEKILYPEAIQSITVSNQANLKVLGIPLTNNLNTVNIINCKYIKTLKYPYNESKPVIDFEALGNVQYLTIDNSLDTTKFNFDGFKKLKELTLRNMMQLELIGFDDMLEIDDEPALNQITLVNMPLIKELTLNCSSEEYKVAFAQGAALNLVGMSSLESIKSNYSIKGLDKIILPSQVKTIEFTKGFGSGTCDITKVYSADSYGEHEQDKEECIDILGLEIKKMRVPNLLKISELKNLNYMPLVEEDKINFQEGRTGSASTPLLNVSGSCDITNYTGSFNNFFGGFDLDNNITLTNDNDFMPQKSLNYMFTNCTASKDVIAECLKSFKNVTNADYMFYNANIEEVDLNNFSGSKIASARGMFEQCIKLHTVTMDKFDLSSAHTLSRMFLGCKALTSIDMSNCSIGKLKYCAEIFKQCESLASVDVSNFGIVSKDCALNLVNSLTESTVENVKMNSWDLSTLTDTSGLFESCNFSGTITARDWNLSSSTSLVNAFKGSKLFGITAERWITPNVTSVVSMLENCSAYNIYLTSWKTDSLKHVSRMCYNCSKLSFLYMPGWDMSKVFNFDHMFYRCTDLGSIGIKYNEWDISNGTSFKYMFYRCGKIDYDIAFPATATDVSYAFYGCSGLKDIHANWQNSYNSTPDSTECYYLCTKIETIGGNAGEYLDVPVPWGGVDFTQDITAIYEIDTTLGSFSNVAFSVGAAGIVSWGDGEITLNENESTKKMSHSYVQDGVYEIRIRNSKITTPNDNSGCSLITKVKQVASNNNSLRYCFTNSASIYATNLPNCTEIDVSNAGNGDITSFEDAFLNLPKLTKITGLDKIDGSKVTNMANMFSYSTMFTNYEILATIDTSNVSNMNNMFEGCIHLTNLNALKDFDTSGSTNMYEMFKECSGLTSLAGLENWDTSNVANMSYMFKDCYGLSDISALSGFKTSKVSTTRAMFLNCSSIKKLDALYSWNTENVNDMSEMFEGCSQLSDASGLSGWNTSIVSTMGRMFKDCRYLVSLSFLAGWNTSRLTDMTHMFDGCVSLIDISALGEIETSNVQNYYYMLNNVPLTKDQIQEVANGLSFRNVSNISILGQQNSSSADLLKPILDKVDEDRGLENITNLSALFKGWSNLIALDRFKNSSIATIKELFYGCSSLTDISILKDMDVSNVHNMSHAFYGCSKLTDISAIADWDVSSVSNAEYMFYRCPLVSLAPLKNWNVTTLSNMNYMFAYCGNSEAQLIVDESNIGSWPIKYIYSMEHTFENGYFSSITLKWNCGITIVSRTFYASTLTYLDISSINAFNMYGYSTNSGISSGFIGDNVETFMAPKNISVNFNVSNAVKLTVESLESIIDNLYTVSENRTLTLGKTNINKLELDVLMAATNKGWTVV